MSYMKTIGYILLAVMFVSTVPYAAEAAKIRIKPHQLKPINPSSPYNYQEPAHVRGYGGTASYYAVVNLPVGKTITRLTVHHRSTSTESSNVDLYRNRFGQVYDHVATAFSADNTGGDVVPISTTEIYRPKVKAGYTYFVWVLVQNTSYVHGVVVHYE